MYLVVTSFVVAENSDGSHESECVFMSPRARLVSYNPGTARLDIPFVPWRRLPRCRHASCAVPP